MGPGVDSPTFGIRATFCGYSGAVCGLWSHAWSLSDDAPGPKSDAALSEI